METSGPKRATVEQLEFLARCMEALPELALSRAKTPHESENSQRKWKQIAAGLNKMNPMFTKTGKEWLRYWVNLKFKIRRKYLQQKKSVNGPNLTPYEQRLLNLLTDDEGNLLNGVVGADVNGVSRNDPEHLDSTSTHSSMDNKPVPTEQIIITTKQSRVPIMEEHEDNTSVNSSHDEEDPIGTNESTIEELQANILRFKLKRQKEMHDLEIAQIKERHKREMDILDLRKKKMIQEIERMKKSSVKRRRNCT